jgi:hypothetical protein
VTTGLAALEARSPTRLAFLQLPAPRWTPQLEHDGQASSTSPSSAPA